MPTTTARMNAIVSAVSTPGGAVFSPQSSYYSNDFGGGIVAGNPVDWLPWGVNFGGGPDGLHILDLTTPTAPVVTVGGVYSIVCRFAASGGTPGDDFLAEFVLPGHYVGGTLPVVSPYGELSGTGIADTGGETDVTVSATVPMVVGDYLAARFQIFSGTASMTVLFVKIAELPSGYARPLVAGE